MSGQIRVERTSGHVSFAKQWYLNINLSVYRVYPPSYVLAILSWIIDSDVTPHYMDWYL